MALPHAQRGSELRHEATVKQFFTVQTEGRRQVQREVAHYSSECGGQHRDPSPPALMWLTPNGPRRTAGAATNTPVNPFQLPVGKTTMNKAAISMELFSIGLNNTRAVKAAHKYNSDTKSIARKLKKFGKNKLPPDLAEELETYVLALECQCTAFNEGQAYRTQMNVALDRLQKAVYADVQDEAFIAKMALEHQARLQQERQNSVQAGKLVLLHGGLSR